MIVLILILQVRIMSHGAQARGVPHKQALFFSYARLVPRTRGAIICILVWLQIRTSKGKRGSKCS